MKIYFRIFLISLVVLSHSAVAQFVSVPYTMHTPYGNVPMNNYVYVPTYYNNGTSNPKFEFEVTLKNDSVIKFKSRILSENKKLYILLKEKKVKRKIFPNETKYVVGNSSTWGIMKGIAADSCWLFGVRFGAINCFTSIPIFDISYTMAIKKGDSGDIMALNKENLKNMVGPQDEKLSKLIEKGKLIKAIEYYNEKNKTIP